MSKEELYYVNQIFEIVESGGLYKYVISEAEEGAVSVHYEDYIDGKWKRYGSEMTIHGTKFVREVAELMLRMCTHIETELQNK